MANAPTTAADKRGVEAARIPSDQASKLATLKAYRRARGLCFTCGGKFGKDHTCPPTIQLHIVEELLEFLGADAMDMNGDQGEVPQTADIVCCSISV